MGMNRSLRSCVLNLAKRGFVDTWRLHVSYPTVGHGAGNLVGPDLCEFELIDQPVASSGSIETLSLNGLDVLDSRADQNSAGPRPRRLEISFWM
jgi:hypothetical protein